jgi:glucokinase
LALDTADGPGLAEKFKAADYSGLEGALAAFCEKRAIKPGGRVVIGTAAHPDAEGVWRFQNLNPWGIDPKALKAQGWDTLAIVNDFVASSLGAVTASDERLVAVRGGSLGECSRFVVLGPGTGLGLGFVERLEGRWHVQETLGGHMYGACATDEQYMVSKVVRRLRGGEMMFIHEDVCSGVGLPVLYKAVCLCNGQKVQWSEAADIILHRTDPMAAAALRLFHEFLGLFAHNALVTGHAFGGVYLDGGLTQHLAAQGAFDRESFLKFMTLQAAEVVEDKIDSTPVFIINDPFVALQGLSELVRMHG